MPQEMESVRNLTKEVADFVVQSCYEGMPQKAVTTAKKCILDSLGCILAGSVEPVGRIITEYVRDLGGKPQATVIGGGFTTSPPLAALANGVMAHALDYDDSCLSWIGHPTAVLLPAILALGELRHASGKEVIESHVLGIEVAAKVGRSVHANYFKGGWHNTGTVCSIGAAVAAAKILKLNSQQTRVALGIAASEAAGLRKNFGTMTKPFHAGNAAKNGVVAALLAERGFSADESILEERLGFCVALGGNEETLAEVTKTLGAPYDLVSPGAVLKAYPACYGTHKAIESTLFLKNKYGFDAEDILEVQYETEAIVPQVLRYHQPKTPLEGKFSLEYCVAIAALDGRVGLAQFTKEKVADPKVQQLLQRVKYAPVSGAAEKRDLEFPERVTIKLRDGRQYSHEISVVKGAPRRPMTREERLSKYRECAGLVLGAEQIERSLSLVTRLEALEDITQLMDFWREVEK